ncbi:MAG TPA: GNAT family N-acetyltransferase [Tissierellia bacterium]|nr:GNAT family N-acetyltransferase [Tissierellia bacterium]
MDKTTVLESSRLRIRFAGPEDIAYVLALEHHPANRDFVWQGTAEQHQQAIDQPDYALMIVERTSDEQAIGYCLCWLNRTFHWLELRRLVISQKGQGYGQETILCLFEYFFDTLGVNKIWLDVYPHNQVGIHLYEKLGMHRDGRLRQNYYSDETGYLDQVVYSILRTEYAAQKR